MEQIPPTLLHRRQYVISAALFAVGTLAVLLAVSQGGRNRIVSPHAAVIALPRMDTAYDIWARQGVRGRILVYCDRSLDIAYPYDPRIRNDSVPFVLAEHYVYRAVTDNLVRKIYHVVPDRAWDDVARNLQQFPVHDFSDGVFRIVIFDGVPLHVTRIGNLPRIKEPVLLHINAAQWDENDFSGIIRALQTRTIMSDMITLAGGSAAERVADLQSYVNAF